MPDWEEELIKRGYTKDEKGNWQSNSSRAAQSRRAVGEGVRDGGSDALPEPEPAVQRKTPAKARPRKSDEAAGAGELQYRVQVTAYSRRDIDPDNLCPKYFIDCLVRGGVLPSDSSRHIAAVEKKVERVQRAEEERTVIEIFKKCETFR